MAPELFIKGLIIGFSIAMPVGPIGLLCIRNVLAFGMIYGLITGLGAACADAIYGAIDGFGITAISSFLQEHSLYLKVIGALFLCYLGIVTFFAKAPTADANKKALTPTNAFLTTFVLTLVNPMTIISFAAIYAGLGIGGGSSDTTGALITTLGVFLGSVAWWLILSLISAIFKDKMNAKMSAWFNKFSGSVIFGFGAVTLIVL